MGDRIGIIAGSGEFPYLALEEAQKRGYTCVVAGIEHEADIGLKDKADEFDWIKGGDILKLVSFFKRNRIQKVLLAGKVDYRRIFHKDKLKKPVRSLLNKTKEKRPAAIIGAIINYMNGEGIEVIDPTSFLAPYLCREGIMTEAELSPEIREDVDFGLKIARKIADLDIGQTVVVKNEAVVAVEGVEGTDEAIRRGGELAGEGVVVAKVGRSSQDIRVDLPGVGLSTIITLVEARGKALCIEAGKVLFLQQEDAISLANENKILVMAKNISHIK
ncbi:MAG: LpxI family protein [Candidatus Aminicenantaceae bacterium]